METHTAQPNPSLENGIDKTKSPLTEKVRETLHDSVDALATKAADAEAGLRDGTKESADAIENQAQKFQSRWEQSRVKQYASENPVAAAGIAFAVGALAASFFSRK